MLEKTLESLLDCKIKPVNCKGNQSRIFIGRTDNEAEAAILWSPDVKNWLNGKDPDAGKDWRQKEKGTTEDEMVTNLMDMSLSKLWELVMPSNHLILCWPLLFLPLVFLSIRVFSVLHIRWPNYWSFSFSISPLNEYSGLISFTIDWFDLAVQGTLKRVFTNTTVQKHQFFGAELAL